MNWALIVLSVIVLMSSVVSFRTAVLRIGYGRFAKRAFVTSSALQSHGTDSFPTILSRNEFTKAYPNYVLNENSFVVPSAVGPQAMREVCVGLAEKLLPLFEMYAGSRWPFVSEIVRYMIRLADMKYRPCDKKVLNDDNGEEAYQTHESTGEVMSPTRWVFFAQTKEEHIKLVVQYRYQSLITDEAEFWEACAEGVRACEKNVLASAKNEQNVSTETALSAPVYVALTDWVNWRFIKIQDREINVSPVITPFPECEEGMRYNPDLVTLLQYLCCAVDVNAQSYEDVQELWKRWRLRVESSGRSFRFKENTKRKDGV